MGCITMIASGRDGAGKSAVTALLGQTIADSGKKVLIVELDNDAGCMDIFTASAGTVIYDIGDLFTGRCTPHEAISHSTLSENLDVIYSTHKRSNYPMSEITDELISFSNEYDYVLVDTECTDEALDTVSVLAMHSIIVSPPDPISLRDTKTICDILYERSTPDLRLLLNRVEKGYFTSGVIKNLDYCVDTVGVRLIGALPESDDIRKALFTGAKLPKKSPIRIEFENIAARLEGEDRAPAITMID